MCTDFIAVHCWLSLTYVNVCICHYTGKMQLSNARLLYCSDAFLNTLHIVLEGCISQYTRLLYSSDASHNTLDYCIGGMHLTIH